MVEMVCSVGIPHFWDEPGANMPTPYEKTTSERVKALRSANLLQSVRVHMGIFGGL